jgi:hypothetical protein
LRGAEEGEDDDGDEDESRLGGHVVEIIHGGDGRGW